MYKGNSRVYMGLQGYARDYRHIKGITNMGVQEYTRDYRGIEGYTGEYKGFPRDY